MPAFSKSVGKFLNSVYNPNRIIENLKEQIDYTYDRFVNYNNVIPPLTTDLADFIQDYNPLPYYENLTETELVGSINKRIGFSELLIRRSLQHDPKLLIDYLIDFYSNLYSEEKYIFKKSQNLCLLNGLNILLKPSLIQQLNYSHKSWRSTKSLLSNIFKQEEYTISTENYNSIDLLLITNYIYNVFSRITNFPRVLENYIRLNTLFTYTDFNTSFNTFLTNNIDNIGNDCVEFLLRNVFTIEGETDLFKSNVNTVVSSLIEDITDIFNIYSKGIVNTGFINNTCEQTARFLFLYSAMKSTIEDLYPNKDTYWDINNDNIVQVEQDILNTIKSSISTNQYSLKYLSYISYQFKWYPLFFINSQIYSYSEFIEYLLTDNNNWLFPVVYSYVGAINIRTDRYKWIESDSTPDEYYLTYNGDVSVTPSPVRVYEGHYSLERGVAGSLGYGQWDYNDNDYLKYKTIYIRLLSSDTNRDPNILVDGDVSMSTTLTVNDLISDVPLKNLWDSSKDDGISDLKDYLLSYSFPYEESKAGTLACYVSFHTLLQSFVSSDLFKDFIIDIFLPQVIDKIREKYAVTIDLTICVDPLLIYFRSLFLKYLFDDVLFSDIITNFNASVDHVFTNELEVGTTIGRLRSWGQNEFGYNINYTHIFNSLFMSISVSNYLNKMLDIYRL